MPTGDGESGVENDTSAVDHILFNWSVPAHKHRGSLCRSPNFIHYSYLLYWISTTPYIGLHKKVGKNTIGSLHKEQVAEFEYM